MNKRDGNIVAFLMELEYLDVEKPVRIILQMSTGSNYAAGRDRIPLGLRQLWKTRRA